MRYRGRQLKGPRIKVVPIIRDESEGGNIFLKVQSIVDFQPFLDKCPQPDPPYDILPGNRKRVNTDDKSYMAEITKWMELRTAWTAIQSLAATEDLIWEEVKIDEPDTWSLYQKELRESGFADAEIVRIINAIFEVNGLNEAMVEEARQSFLTTQGVPQNGQASHQDEAKNTQSGEPAPGPVFVNPDLKKLKVGTT